MRSILIISLLFLFWSCTSCNENAKKTDVDIHDSDKIQSDTNDIDSIVDEIPDPDVTDVEIQDSDADADLDSSIECLDLKIQKNVINTPFPFTAKEGKPTFCRPGCDTPTETDPQCVRNIWEWDNWEHYQEYLEAEKKDSDQYGKRECYPWPCQLPDMKALTGEDLKTPCDRYISVNGYDGSMGYVWSHGMSDGVAGILMSNGAIEYDPEKDEFFKLGQAAGRLIYNKNRYIVSVEDRDNTEKNIKSFVVSIERGNGKYYYELIYDNKVHDAFFSRPPFVGKDWVLIQVCEGPDGACDVKYAKSDKWEWHSLNVGKVQEGNIVDDRLSFILHDGTADRQIYYCDMSKYPSSFKDCTKVTREIILGKYELGHSPRIDEDDKERLIYYINDAPEPTLVTVNFKEGKKPEYNEIKVERRFQTEKVKGNIMMYTTSDNNSNFMSCWYRFDKNRSYCPITHDWVTGDMLFATFTEKWQLYKGSVTFLLRDWECYCKETGVCPVEE